MSCLHLWSYPLMISIVWICSYGCEQGLRWPRGSALRSPRFHDPFGKCAERFLCRLPNLLESGAYVVIRRCWMWSEVFISGSALMQVCLCGSRPSTIQAHFSAILPQLVGLWEILTTLKSPRPCAIYALELLMSGLAVIQMFLIEMILSSSALI